MDAPASQLLQPSDAIFGETNQSVSGVRSEILSLRKFLSLTAVLASCFVSAQAQESKTAYTLQYCELGDVSSVLVFKDLLGQARHVAFMERYQEFAVRTPTLKGVVNWATVDRIELAPVTNNPNVRILTIVLKKSEYVYGNIIELGIADTDCLTRIEGRYKNWIEFRIIE